MDFEVYILDLSSSLNLAYGLILLCHPSYNAYYFACMYHECGCMSKVASLLVLPPHREWEWMFILLVVPSLSVFHMNSPITYTVSMHTQWRSVFAMVSQCSLYHCPLGGRTASLLCDLTFRPLVTFSPSCLVKTAALTSKQFVL